MEKSGFFNSSNGDRKYKAEFFAEYFSSFIGNGVFPNPSTSLQIISNNNMTVTLKAGKAWINGYYYNNDSDLVFNIDVADGVLKRIDRVVLQYNTINRTISTKVKKGTFASSPVAPVLKRDADAFELGIADIYIANGATSISQANITDLRLDTAKCGIVHGVIEQVDTTTLWNQYQAKFEENSQQFEADFNAWFTTIQAALDGDTAGNLLNLINQNTTEINSVKSDLAEKATITEVNEVTTILTPSGNANAITLPVTLVNGKKYSFKATANSTGAVTINGFPFKKLDGTQLGSGGVKANKVYDFYYDQAQNSVFILAKAEGDALVGDVLAGKTFSNDDDTGLVGTLNLSNLTSENIKNGVVINNVSGTFNGIENLQLPSGRTEKELVAVDENYLYFINSSTQKQAYKYTHDGSLVKSFDVTNFSGSYVFINGYNADGLVLYKYSSEHYYHALFNENFTLINQIDLTTMLSPMAHKNNRYFGITSTNYTMIVNNNGTVEYNVYSPTNTKVLARFNDILIFPQYINGNIIIIKNGDLSSMVSKNLYNYCIGVILN